MAVVASLGVLIWRASEPRLTLLGRARGGLEPLDLRTSPEAPCPDWSSCARTRCSSSPTPPRSVTASCRKSRAGSAVLGRAARPVAHAGGRCAGSGRAGGLHGRLADHRAELWLSHLRPSASATLDLAGILRTIGASASMPAHRTASWLSLSVHRRASASQSSVPGCTRSRRSRPGTIEEAAAVPGALGRRLTLELEPAAGSDVASLV